MLSQRASELKTQSIRRLNRLFLNQDYHLMTHRLHGDDVSIRAEIVHRRALMLVKPFLLDNDVIHDIDNDDILTVIERELNVSPYVFFTRMDVDRWAELLLDYNFYEILDRSFPIWEPELVLGIPPLTMVSDSDIFDMVNVVGGELSGLSSNISIKEIQVFRDSTLIDTINPDILDTSYPVSETIPGELFAIVITEDKLAKVIYPEVIQIPVSTPQNYDLKIIAQNGESRRFTLMVTS